MIEKQSASIDKTVEVCQILVFSEAVFLTRSSSIIPHAVKTYSE